MSIKRIEPAGRLSKAVVHNGTVYLAGLTADNDSLDISGQTQQILDKIDHYLAETGSDKTKLLSAVIYLTEISLKEGVATGDTETAGRDYGHCSHLGATPVVLFEFSS